jgi:hypothetical protein
MSQTLNGNVPEFAKWPCPAPDEIDAAARVLDSGKIRYETGQQGRLFEKEFAEFVGCRYAIALANTSLALETALHAVGVTSGDEVIISSRTLMAAAQRAVAIGARPVIADVDRQSQNVTVETILPLITPVTKAVVAVHLAGWPCEMDGILQLARERGFKVIEDCTQAQGAKYNGKPVGSMGDAAAFSFGHDGIMTIGGEGSMFVTNNTEAWQRASVYQEHRNGADGVDNRTMRSGIQHFPGMLETSGRMTEVQSAIGRIALKKVYGWVETRRKYAAILHERLAPLRGLWIATPPVQCFHAYYKYYAFVRPECLRSGWSRDRILMAIRAEGVPCFVDSCSDEYRKKAFVRDRRDPARNPISKQLRESGLMFLVHPALDLASIDYTCRSIEKVLEYATRANPSN